MAVSWLEFYTNLSTSHFALAGEGAPDRKPAGHILSWVPVSVLNDTIACLASVF